MNRLPQSMNAGDRQGPYAHAVAALASVKANRAAKRCAMASTPRTS